MGRVIRPGTVPRVNELSRHRHGKRTCASAPAVPANVALSFHRRRTLGPSPQYRARATWDATTLDVAGRPISPEMYQVQLRATDASGDPVETMLQDQAASATGAAFTVHGGSAPVNKLARELNASGDIIKKTLTGLTTGIATQVQFLAREDVGGSAPVLKFEIWNVTDGTSVVSKNGALDGIWPKLYARETVTPVAGKTYEARVSWVSGSGIGLLDHIQWHALGNNAVWRANIPADESPLDANFPDVARPRTWYYQTRVRAMNRIHGARCYSAWSAWTTAQNPVSLATIGPPAPTGLVLVLDKVEGSRPRPWRAKLQWNETPWWVPPDADAVNGAAAYHVQLAASNNGGTTTANVRRKTVEADDSDGNATANAQFLANIRGKRHYRGRVKAVDEQGRRGAWSGWTAWASPGGEPAPPINLTWSNPNPRTLVAVWDDPTDMTDVDRYRVRVIRGASTVVEDRYTVSNKSIYHIPLADRNSTHKVRVTSVEAETLLDVDEVAPTGWDTPQTSSDVDSSDVSNSAVIIADIHTANDDPFIRTTGFPRFKGSYSAGASPNTGADTYVRLGTVQVDTDVFQVGATTDAINAAFPPASTYYLQLPFAGQYLVIVTDNFAANATGRRDIFMDLNDVLNMRHTETPQSNSAAFRGNLAGVLDATAGDLISFGVFQSSGAGLALNQFRVSLVYLGDA